MLQGLDIVAPEILAPAGNLHKMRAAIAWGAEAVYLALPDYGLRAAPTAFDPETFEETVAEAHRAGVKVYCTMNILCRPHDLNAVLDERIDCLQQAGVDAAIVADPAMLRRIKKRWPSAVCHLSTQASVSNAEAALFWAEQGIERLVFARELTLDELASIRRDLPLAIEMEAFVHGSMCMAWSGRCLLSDAMAGRRANQGSCAGSCRWSYHLMEEKRPGEYWPIMEDQHGSYILSSKDLCMIEHLPELLQAGLNSWKIEGRARSAAYTAIATGAYRRGRDLLMHSVGQFDSLEAWRSSHREAMQALLQELESLPHRPYSTGFYELPPIERAQIEREIRQCWQREIFAERVSEEEAPGDGNYLRQLIAVDLGAEVEWVCPDGQIIPFTIKAILDEKGEKIDRTRHPAMIFSLPEAPPAPPYAFLRAQAS